MNLKIDNYFVGGAGFLGAFLANFSVGTLSRRHVLLVGHFFIMVGHILMYTFIRLEIGTNTMLASMLTIVLSFQMSNGGMFFMYAAEVVVDAGIGLCLMVLLGLLVLQTLTVELFFDIDAIGIKGVFIGFGGFQLLLLLFIFIFVRETKGLNTEQKKNLYKPK